jgi:hypothetical protein
LNVHRFSPTERTAAITLSPTELAACFNVSAVPQVKLGLVAFIARAPGVAGATLRHLSLKEGVAALAGHALAVVDANAPFWPVPGRQPSSSWGGGYLGNARAVHIDVGNEAVPRSVDHLFGELAERR